MSFLIIAKLLLIFALGQAPVPPINSVGAATGCDNETVQCVYTDVAVPPGPYFYFVVASNSNGQSGPSNVVNVVVPSGTHNVVLTWTPSITTSPTPTYYVFRGGVPTNLKITGVS
jgi:hypothetical protein